MEHVRLHARAVQQQRSGVYRDPHGYRLPLKKRRKILFSLLLRIL
jgi:hypothetical protein